MRTAGRLLLVTAGLVVLWQSLVWLSGVPPFILPGPDRVALALWRHWDSILRHAGVTGTEILLGMALGTLLGAVSALTLAAFRGARAWLLPVLIGSQAVPVFAIAPLLTLWLGYGMASKVAMATLIIYFPVTASFYDGLRHVPQGWLELARTMAPHRPRWVLLVHVAVPAALPALASGLRVAAATAPIGAVVGEWVGSSRGLGHLMLQANGRMQVDLTFAALLALALLAIALYFTVDRLLKTLLPWHQDTSTTTERR